MTSRLLTVVAIVVLAQSSHARAQNVASAVHADRTQIACPRSLSWMLTYVAPNNNSDPVKDKLVELPCFKRALEKAFPNAHSFMGKELVATTALLFVQVHSISGPTSSDGRYITVDGCVRHSCPDAGMIWIDTFGNGQIVFAASRDIPANGNVYSDMFHLWLYSSKPIPENQQLPQPLLASLQNVYAQEEFVSAMIVQPNGEMLAALPSTLHLNQIQATPAK
jgi:hypothetical protein